jgi:hypothetical protein
MNQEKAKPKLVELDETLSIARPDEFDIDQFKSDGDPGLANVDTLQTALPVHKIAEANDFVLLHPDEKLYWSKPLCFVNIPIKGQKRDTLHIIQDKLARRFLPSKRILRYRLALASRPFNAFFLCIVPTMNIDNSWVASNLTACEWAKGGWVQVTSRKDEGVDAYKITFAQDADAFATPDWPTQPLEELVRVTFEGRAITREDHPAILRMIGAKQNMS